MPDFYINRTLSNEGAILADHDVVALNGVLVVLAEPGAGKSDFLEFLGRQLGAKRLTAATLVGGSLAKQLHLIIDGLDEVARLNELTTNGILIAARDTGASTVILASRSYAWDQARTQFIRDCFGIEPTILRLEPLTEDEQQRFFAHLFPDEDFLEFRREADRFELTPLFGNPLFLSLFANAFVEEGRRFSSKGQIYAAAVQRLAIERLDKARADRPAISTLVKTASEIFAKLLLSGATGVSFREEVGGEGYPYLGSLILDASTRPFVLNTQLFKPADAIGNHDPVHRVVAEYCAARYLTERIENSANTLSLRRILAVIAPNGAVRDELRGMLGWIASLGRRTTQETIIDLDPYAVFANGDPSRLLPMSKRRLLRGLETLAEIDPYFRRMDAWRRFSIAGFFSPDVLDEVQRLLTAASSKSHLKGLLLELLENTEAASALAPEMRAILVDPANDANVRSVAQRNLAHLGDHHHKGDFDAMLAENSAASLKLAAEMVDRLGVGTFGLPAVLALLTALAKLYPTGDKRERTIGARYFIRQLIAKFSIDETRLFLDQITGDLTCSCGAKKPYGCTCRIGPSNIAGLLLDQYFELAVGPHQPERIDAWTRPLKFRGHVADESSASVKALHADDSLRRAIQLRALGGLSDPTDIAEAAFRFYPHYSHVGLIFLEGDIAALVDHAFSSGNVPLWQHFFAAHNIYSGTKGPNALRAHMRAQARNAPDFLRVWARQDRFYRLQQKKAGDGWRHSRRRYTLRQEGQREIQRKHLNENRDQIEAGRHWGWLVEFAQLYLYKDEEITAVLDDTHLPERALLNCFDFLTPHVPTLEILADQKGGQIAMVLEAACLAKFRRDGSLAGVAMNILGAVKANGIGGNGFREGEADRLDAELDSRLFHTEQDLIDFAKRYLEPQFKRKDDAATRVHMIDTRLTFNAVKGRLALDWLARFPQMQFAAMDTLFGIAVQHGDRTELCTLIEVRCRDPKDSSEIGAKRRTFWLLRHFFFIHPTLDAYWMEYSSDPKAIFGIEHYAGRLSRHDATGWPTLDAEKIWRVLDAFILTWPKVELPSSWGTGDPEDEMAYRFLTDVIYQIGRDNPSNAIRVFERLLSDPRFGDFGSALKSLKAEATRQLALVAFHPPKPAEIVRLLDATGIASVEDLRALLVEQLGLIQVRLKGAATDPLDVFYSGGKRVDENIARNRLVEMLDAQLTALNLVVNIEHHMAHAKRCDITASTVIDGKPIVLVTEVKGQWHDELYSAASTQLAERYMIYPGAAQQGIYLVLWFGGDEKIAGKSDPSITSPAELCRSIIASLANELRGAIDVIVLDLWRPAAIKRTKLSRRSRKGKST